jgi:hypothetical protein
MYSLLNNFFLRVDSEQVIDLCNLLWIPSPSLLEVKPIEVELLGLKHPDTSGHFHSVSLIQCPDEIGSNPGCYW